MSLLAFSSIEVKPTYKYLAKQNNDLSKEIRSFSQYNSYNEFQYAKPGSYIKRRTIWEENLIRNLDESNQELNKIILKY